MVGKTSCTFRQGLVLAQHYPYVLESERAPADMPLGLSRGLDCVLLKSSRNSGGTELLRLHRQRRIIRLGADKDPEPGLLVVAYDRCRRLRPGVELKHKSMYGVSDVPADKETRQPLVPKSILTTRAGILLAASCSISRTPYVKQAASPRSAGAHE